MDRAGEWVCSESLGVKIKTRSLYLGIIKLGSECFREGFAYVRCQRSGVQSIITN